MLFRKRHKSGGEGRGEAGEVPGHPELYRIEYDMMLKGSHATRRGKPIRQYGVTVDGATRLITSGDAVDRKTYEALVAAGAIKAPSREAAFSREEGTQPSGKQEHLEG